MRPASGEENSEGEENFVCCLKDTTDPESGEVPNGPHQSQDQACNKRTMPLLQPWKSVAAPADLLAENDEEKQHKRVEQCQGRLRFDL